MKKLTWIIMLLGSYAVLGQDIQQQQQSNCPSGTTLDSYQLTKTDSDGTVISTTVEFYCRRLYQVQQPTGCPNGTVVDIYTEVARDNLGNVVSTRFQTYCREL